MSKPLLALCSIPTVMDKDGHAGRNAKVLLPFSGYWYASGARMTYPGATMAQDGSRKLTGRNMADTFQKDAISTCLGH